MVFTAVKSAGNLVPLVLVDWMGRKPLIVVSHAPMASVTAAYGAGLHVVANGPVDKLYWRGGRCCRCGRTPRPTLCLHADRRNVRGQRQDQDGPAVRHVPGRRVVPPRRYLHTTIAQAFGVYANYFMYSAFNLVWAVAAAFVMVETKGKTFLEIEQMLAS